MTSVLLFLKLFKKISTTSRLASARRTGAPIGAGVRTPGQRGQGQPDSRSAALWRQTRWPGILAGSCLSEADLGMWLPSRLGSDLRAIPDDEGRPHTSCPQAVVL